MDDSLLERLKALGVKMGEVSAPRPSKHQAIEDVLDGRVAENPFGQCFVVEKKYPPDHMLGTTELGVVDSLGLLADIHQIPHLRNISSDRCIFLDTETTGLSQSAGTFPFLTGLCRPAKDGVQVTLLMARSPSEEPAMLIEMCRYLSDCDAIVTYNGKTFDIPLLETRMAYHAISSPFKELGHIDLLQLTRKLWKHTLPSRSLGYIEMSILGISRTDDEVPGYLIPQMYYEYIKSGDARPLVGVLYHNEMDILSLVALLNYFQKTAAQSLQSLNPQDLLAVVEAIRLTDHIDSTDELLEEILGLDLDVRDWPRIQKLADWYKRKDLLTQSIRIYEKAAEANQFWAQMELARYAENSLKAYDQALYWCDRMLATLETQNLSPFKRSSEIAEIQKRIDRILRKTNRI